MCLGRLWGESRGNGGVLSGRWLGLGVRFLLLLLCRAGAGLHCQADLPKGAKKAPHL